MCGILGVYDSSGVNKYRFNESLNKLYHRGPDNQSEKEISKKLFFGHTRLSIIDPIESSNQPFVDFQNKLIITYNGEIYNYKKLKDELINYGYKPTLYYVPMPEYCYVSDSPMSHYLDFTVSHIHKKPQLLNYLLNHENNQHIEIAQHGLTHHNKKNYKYHSFEFDGINQSEILEKLKVGKKLLSDIFHISGFKPPAWSVGKLYDKSVEFSDSLQKMHYDYVSLSSPTNGLNYSSHCVSHIHKSKISEMINVPQNISVLWDKEYIKDVIREISHKNGIINVQIHFQEADKYLQDGLNEKIVDKLKFVFDESVRCGYRASLTRDVK